MHIRTGILLLLVGIVVSSCSLQKRRYTDGYYVQWHKSKTAPASKTEPSLSKEEPESKTSASNAHDVLLTSVENSLNPIELQRPKLFSAAPEDSCDILIFKDGSEVKAKILEVGINEIKYKRCSNLEGPNHISRKSEIFMIKYANGTKEVIRSETPEPLKTYQAPAPSKSYNYSRAARRNHPLALPSLLAGAGSVVVAYFLLILIGTLYLSFLVFAISLALGLTAFIIGKIALAEIKEHPETWKGKGLAIPGVIMGAIIAGISALILFLALAFA